MQTTQNRKRGVKNMGLTVFVLIPIAYVWIIIESVLQGNFMAPIEAIIDLFNFIQW